MKKILALALAAMMIVSMAACSSQTPDTTTGATENTTAPTEQTTAPTEETTEPTEEPTEAPAAPTDVTPSLKIMNDIFALYTEENKPFVMGGDFEHIVDGAPGNYDLTDPSGLSGILYVPADQLANIDEAATAMHAMMANNFTAGVVHVTADVTAFANTMVDTLQNNQWMCGIPESLIVAVVDGEYVLAGFGASVMIDDLVANLNATYPEAQIVYNGALSA